MRERLYIMVNRRRRCVGCCSRSGHQESESVTSSRIGHEHESLSAFRLESSCFHRAHSPTTARSSRKEPSVPRGLASAWYPSAFSVKWERCTNPATDGACRDKRDPAPRMGIHARAIRAAIKLHAGPGARVPGRRAHATCRRTWIESVTSRPLFFLFCEGLAG